MATPISFSPVNHIENRRLLDAAYGFVRLDAWERLHVHGCHVCQGVFYVFVVQEMGILPQRPKKQE